MIDDQQLKGDFGCTRCSYKILLMKQLTLHLMLLVENTKKEGTLYATQKSLISKWQFEKTKFKKFPHKS